MDDHRPWDGLMPDTLGLIFQKLSLQEILCVVPRVCKSWASVVRGPYCWYEIDIMDWSTYCEPKVVDRMLRMLISRSSGSLRKLCVSGLSNDNTLSLIADNAKSLQELQLPRSGISDSIVEQVAPRLSSVTSLNLSSCSRIGPVALEALGKHCKSLTTLLRSMGNIDSQYHDSEAQAIAAAMPNLRRLELAYMQLSIDSVVRLVTSLKDLELLDVGGCCDVELDQDLLDKFPKLRVIGPLLSNSYGSDYYVSDDDWEGYAEGLRFDIQLGSSEDYDDQWGDGEDHNAVLVEVSVFRGGQ